MNLLSVENYKELLGKLAWYALFVGIVCAVVLRSNVGQIDQFAAKVDIVFPADLNEMLPFSSIPFGTLLPGLLAAGLSHVFKLHDKLSSLLYIRYDFDIRWIMVPMAALSSAKMTTEKMEKLGSQRHAIMKDVFYKYASSSAGRQVIDPHTITQALTNWSWFWCCLESCAFLIVTCITLIIFGKWQAATWILLICFLLIIVMRLLRAESSKSATAQVEEILNDPDRRSQIKARFDAL